MSGFLHVTPADIATVGPETFLCVLGMALILLDAFAKGMRPSFPYVTLAGLAVANFLGGYPAGTGTGTRSPASGITSTRPRPPTSRAASATAASSDGAWRA